MDLISPASAGDFIMVEMKELYTIFIFILLHNVVLPQNLDSKFTISMYSGINQESLNWSISGDINGMNPNILSELKWKNLRGLETVVSTQFYLSKRFLFNTALTHQKITVGKVTDNDYAGDNRTFNTSELDLKSDKGHTLILDANFAYKLFNDGRFHFQPQIGYWGKFQTLYLLDGDVPLISGKLLNSTSRPNWQGIQYGVTAGLSYGSFFSELEFNTIYILNYSAKANWNLQTTFNHPLSFVHSAKGNGFQISFVQTASLSANFLPFVKFKFSTLKSGSGKDMLFLENGEIESSKLNGVDNQSWSILFGLKIKI